MDTVPEEFIFFLFIDLNEVHYPVYLPLRIVAECQELMHDEVLELIEQELSNVFLQDPTAISRNDLEKIIHKYSPKYMWFIDEINNSIIDELENIFGDSIMCAEHYLMWKGKGQNDYLIIKQDVEELAKLYNCNVHEIQKDQVNSFLIKLQEENSCRVSNAVYLHHENTTLNELEEADHEELWPEEEIKYKMELCESIQAEIDAENGENLWINYLNDRIKSDKRTKLKEAEEKLVKEHQEDSKNITDEFYMPKIINHKKILEQFANNYNIYKLMELIRKKYNHNIYRELCSLLQEQYMHNKENRICTLLTKILPLQIRTDPEIYEKLETLEIGYKINSWKRIWTEMIHKIISKYGREEKVEIVITEKKQKQKLRIGKTRKRKTCSVKKKIKPK